MLHNLVIISFAVDDVKNILLSVVLSGYRYMVSAFRGPSYEQGWM